jgi:hypothetical protein
MELPDPIPDGFCAVCRKAAAETRDGRFCKKCLRKYIREANPDPIRRKYGEWLDRKQLDPFAPEGSAELNTDGDD